MRCSICVFWDRLGEARDFVIYYLNSLVEVSDKVLVVVNGKITDDSKSRIEHLGIEVVQRDNKGLDFAAYRYGIEYLGYEKLSSYNELVLTNTTCYGPIYSLKNMFEEMEQRHLDLWGLTQHGEYNDTTWLNKKVKQHIQSYFLVFNKKAFTSKIFKTFFKNINTTSGNYISVVSSYETELTSLFRDNNFTTDSYVPCELFFSKNLNPCFTDALSIIQEYRCPIVKRKVIVPDPDHAIRSATIDQSLEVINYIKKNTCYPIDYIYQDIIKDFPMSKLKFGLHLNYTINKTSTPQLKNIDKIGIIVYVGEQSPQGFVKQIVESCPDYIDVYICCSNDNVITNLKNTFKYGITYIKVHNDISNIGVCVLECKHLIEKYDVIGFFNDQNTTSLDNIKLKETISKESLKSLIYSKEYVNSIIKIFDENKYMGLITSTTPSYFEYARILTRKDLSAVIKGHDLTNNLRDIESTCPKDPHPCFPYSGNYWFRTKSFKSFNISKWGIKDFEIDPDPILGLIHSSKELLIPFIVQNEGFLCGSALPEKFTSSYIDSLFYNPSSYNNNVNIDIEYSKIKKFNIENCDNTDYVLITIFGIRLLVKRFYFSPYNFIRNIFSIRNSKNKKNKIISILFFKINTIKK